MNKKLAALTAAFALAAAMATAVSAAPEDSASPEAAQSGVVTAISQTSTTEDNAPLFDEPLITPELITVAPAPLELAQLTYFYTAPGGDAWGALAPQIVTPSGNMVDGWIEIYTWLGKAWVYAPDYIPYP